MAGKYTDFSRLISQIYVCVEGEPDHRLLSALQDFLGGSDSILFTPLCPPDSGGLWLFGTTSHADSSAGGLDEVSVATGLARQVSENLNALAVAPSKAAATARKTSPQDRLAAVGMVHNQEQRLLSCAISVGGGSSDEKVFYGVRRAPDAPLFMERDFELALLVLGHLDAALSLNRKFRSMRLSSHLADTCCEGLPWAQGIVSEGGRLLQGNRALLGLLDEADSLELENACLGCHFSGDTDRVRGALHELATASGDASASRVIRLRRASGKPDHVLVMLRLNQPEPGGSRCFQIKVIDPTARCVAPCDAFRAIYRLTKAECRLLQVLMSGLSPKEAAVEFEVSANTIRSQLKAIYLKTGVHRQADLLRLAMGLGGLA